MKLSRIIFDSDRQEHGIGVCFNEHEPSRRRYAVPIKLDASPIEVAEALEKLARWCREEAK